MNNNPNKTKQNVRLKNSESFRENPFLNVNGGNNNNNNNNTIPNINNIIAGNIKQLQPSIIIPILEIENQTVSSKIQQLHKKMKKYFNNERKNHSQQILQQLITLKQSIIHLQQQLNKSKSTSQVQEEKLDLLKKKDKILKDIQLVNKKLKQNKSTLIMVKLQNEQLDRQILSSQQTVLKYQNKLKQKSLLKRLKQSKSNYTPNEQKENNNENQNIISYEQNKKRKSHLKNLTECESIQNSILPSLHISKKNSLNPSKDSINIQYKSIDLSSNRQKLQNQIYKKCSIFATAINSTRNKQNLNQNLKKSQNLQKNFKKKNKQFQINQNQKLSDQPNNTQLNQKILKSSQINSFKYRINDTSRRTFQSINKLYSSFLNDSNDIKQIQIKQKKFKRKMLEHIINTKNNGLDLTNAKKKYDQILVKEKYKDIQKLFKQIKYNENHKQSHIKDSMIKLKKNQKKIQQTIKQQEGFSQSVNHLQDLLIQQLRKRLYESYKQKGYHNGLQNKTHQIKLQIKKIFKNYSKVMSMTYNQTHQKGNNIKNQANQFFNQVFKKKSVVNQLEHILIQQMMKK